MITALEVNNLILDEFEKEHNGIFKQVEEKICEAARKYDYSVEIKFVKKHQAGLPEDIIILEDFNINLFTKVMQNYGYRISSSFQHREILINNEGKCYICDEDYLGARPANFDPRERDENYIYRIHISWRQNKTSS